MKIIRRIRDVSSLLKRMLRGHLPVGAFSTVPTGIPAREDRTALLGAISGKGMGRPDGPRPGDRQAKIRRKLCKAREILRERELDARVAFLEEQRRRAPARGD